MLPPRTGVDDFATGAVKAGIFITAAEVPARTATEHAILLILAALRAAPTAVALLTGLDHAVSTHGCFT